MMDWNPCNMKSNLTNILRKEEIVDSQYGHVPYIKWCKLEAERMRSACAAFAAAGYNAVRLHHNPRVAEDGNGNCWIEV